MYNLLVFSGLQENKSPSPHHILKPYVFLADHVQPSSGDSAAVSRHKIEGDNPYYVSDNAPHLFGA
jgi:hypothetical protein